jgi:1,4-alpha-glucan branching enzyme
MLKKRRFQKQKLVKVTFHLPDTPAARVHLMGDFNQWQESHPMKRDKDNSWRATIELEPDREYQFRYLLDGERWLNDPEADRYTPSPFGEENSVVIT